MEDCQQGGFGLSLFEGEANIDVYVQFSTLYEERLQGDSLAASH